MEILALSGTEKEFDDWCGELPIATVVRRLDNLSARAVWTGKPFVVAGEQAAIQEWLDNLDVASREVIRNHAFFWLLTSSGGFEHPLLRDERLTVLDWSKREYNVISEALEWLGRFPLMAGLSYEQQHL